MPCLETVKKNQGETRETEKCFCEKKKFVLKNHPALFIVSYATEMSI
jgi:hypothetical protein